MVISLISLVIRDKQDTILTKRTEDKLKIVYRKRRELVRKQVPSNFMHCWGVQPSRQSSVTTLEDNFSVSIKCKCKRPMSQQILPHIYLLLPPSCKNIHKCAQEVYALIFITAV